MSEQKWYYEKLDEEGKIKRCPMNDNKGEITGKFIINLPAYFDENPEERIRLGWIKHITHEPYKELENFNQQSQYLSKTTVQVDEFTVEDVYNILDKSEEQLLLEEILGGTDVYGGGIVFVGMEEP